MGKSFDQYASAYDAWFLENRNVLYSEVNLVASTLRDAGRILSVGCGSGLFEMILRNEYGIAVTDGIEPSTGMAEIARKRGLRVTIATAEEADFGHGDYDTLLFNGTPSYIGDLAGVVRKAWEALPDGGRIVLIDVPKESSYGLLYNLAKALGTWHHPLLARRVLSPESLPDRAGRGSRMAHDGREGRAAPGGGLPRADLRTDAHLASAHVERRRGAARRRIRQRGLCGRRGPQTPENLRR